MDQDSFESEPVAPQLLPSSPEDDPPGFVHLRPGSSPLQRLAHRLYTSNPFYVISAALVFGGLRMSFASPGDVLQAWGLLGCLAGFTLLLAATSYWLVRHGRLWDDVRTLLLLVVMMFIAISITNDDLLTTNWLQGTMVAAAGLLLAILVSEQLLWGLAIRFPAPLRVPYYLLLALFFVYPVVVSAVYFKLGATRLHWVLFAFAPLSALVLLTLWPAARRGAKLVENNGTPWPWPWFPWPLFVVLGLCAAGRSYYLCLSLDYVSLTASIFGAYFLVPIVFAAAILLLELGLSSGRRSLMLAALALAAVAPLLTLLERNDQLYRTFLGEFRRTLDATPLFVTTCMLAGFYLLAIVRRVPWSVDALSWTLLGLSVLRPYTLDFDDLLFEGWGEDPTALPLMGVAILQMAMAVWRGCSWRALAAVIAELLALAIWFQDTWFRNGNDLLPSHLLILTLYALPLVFDDAFAKFLRALGPWMLLTLAGVSMTGASRFLTPHPDAAIYYPLGCLAFAGAYGMFVRNPQYFVVAVIILAGWIVRNGGRTYQQAQHRVPGLTMILGGVASFLVALLVSLSKIGLPPRVLLARVRGVREEEDNNIHPSEPGA